MTALSLVVVDIGEEPPLSLRKFAVMEGVHTFTNGAARAWADEDVVRRWAQARTGHLGATISWMAHQGLIERAGVSGSARHMVGGVLRLTREGEVEHFHWRPELLPQLREALP